MLHFVSYRCWYEFHGILHFVITAYEMKNGKIHNNPIGCCLLLLFMKFLRLWITKWIFVLCLFPWHYKQSKQTMNIYTHKNNLISISQNPFLISNTWWIRKKGVHATCECDLWHFECEMWMTKTVHAMITTSNIRWYTYLF